MKTKRGIGLLAIVASLALFVGACSSDDKPEVKKSDKSSTTTTEKSQKEDKTDETASTLDNEAFNTALQKVNTDISEAGKEPCALLNALSSKPPVASNKAQSKQLIDTYSVLLRAVGGAIEATSPDSTKVLNDAADKVLALGEKKKYAPSVLTSKDFYKIMDSAETAGALSKFTDLTATCTPDVPVSDTPEGGSTEGSAPQG